MDPSLRVGLELPALPSPVTGGGGPSALDDWLGAARRAGDALGAVWLTGGPGAGDEASCDPCTLAGGLVEALPSTLLGVVVVAGAGRNPAVVAREVTTLDVMSGGRAAVRFRMPSGVEDPPDLLAEAVAVCRAVLTEPHPLFEGRHFHVAGAVNRPSPVRPGGPPVLAEVVGPAPGSQTVGASAAPARLAALARLAPLVDAVVVGGSPDQVGQWRRDLDDVARRAPEHPGGSGTGRTLPLVWRGPARALGRLPEAVGASAAALLGAGADGVVIRADPTPPGADGALGDTVTALAAALAPLTATRTAAGSPP